MSVDWRKLVIAIVAGDRREQEIARLAATTGAEVRAYGIPWPDGGISGVTLAQDAVSALSGADIALFPIPGIAADGALFAPASPVRIIPDRRSLAGMRKPAHIVLGQADENLKGHCRELGVMLHEYESDTTLMFMRGPAIVEVLLKVVIENTDITIHKSKVCVVGQGTIGFLVTRYMVALSAYTHVAARNPVQRAAAHAAGAEAHTLEELETLAASFDIIVSTVPAPVVGRNVLARLPPHALVVDLAAPPGGVDRDAAAELGVKFVWARGMGMRAPQTVGGSQWQGIRRRIESIVASAA